MISVSSLPVNIQCIINELFNEKGISSAEYTLSGIFKGGKSENKHEINDKSV